NRTDYGVGGLTGSTTYYFVVQVYTSDGLISPPSVEVSGTTPSPAPPRLSVSSSTVNPGDSLSILWDHAEGTMTDWIGLYQVDQSNLEYGWWAYTNGESTGSLTLRAPGDPGLYEFRYLLNNGFTDVAHSSTIAVQVPNNQFTVTATPGLLG